MKKTILSFCLFWLLSFAGAQNAPFPLPGMIYGEAFYCNYFDCPNGEYSNYSFFYKGDTTLCGVTYHQLAFVQNPSNVVHLRVENGKYIILQPTFIPCTSEFTLYDFNLEVGDKFPANDFNWLVDSLTVFQKDSVLLSNGEMRKRILLRPLPYTFPIFEWVDGIGDIQNGFFLYSDFEGGHEEIICVKDNSGLLFQNTNPNLDCDSILCRVPRPDFTFDCVGQTINFENSSKFSVNYEWDFGDGSAISVEDSPSHTYSTTGCYWVTLFAYSACLPHPFKRVQQVNVAVGDYWQPVFTPDFNFTQVEFLNSSLGWAVGENTIHKTTDGGLTWQHTDVPPPAYPDNQYLRYIDFFDEMHGVAVAYNSFSSSDPSIKTALWTEDGGMSWQYGNAPNGFYPGQVVMSSQTTGYAPSGFEMYRTIDGGKNWEEMTNQNFHYTYEVFPISVDTVYYFASYFIGPGYYLPMILGKSTDGVNFDFVEIDSSDVPGLVGNIWPTSMYFTDASNGWMTTSNGFIIHTADGGITWELQFNAPIFF